MKTFLIHPRILIFLISHNGIKHIRNLNSYFNNSKKSKEINDLEVTVLVV